MPCGFCDGIADMFRYETLDTDFVKFIFRYIGDDLTSFPDHSPQEISHKTLEIAKEFVDHMPLLNVERS